MDGSVAESGCSEKRNFEGDSKMSKPKYPKAVFLVIVNELCERFSYYALRAVLPLFLKQKLSLSENDATIVFHTFNMACYFFPILGGIISDSYIGKFRTILYLSLIYTLGEVVLALAAWRELGLPELLVACAGLLLVAMGAGGIKPCVSSFGGDQFVLPQQQRHLERFFSVFYWIINAGGCLGILVAPQIRTLHCLGEDSCYPLAFGMPAILMIFFCGVFLVGKLNNLYIIKKPEGNVLVKICRCMWVALRSRGRAKQSPEGAKAHWLDAAAPRFGDALVADIKVLLKLLVIATPLPMFWALFDMQGTRWVFQAQQLDGSLGGWTILPDQISLSAMVLMMLTLPPLEAWVHPWLARRGLLATPLQRMSVGGLMAALAFVAAGVLQLCVDRAGDAQIHMLWQLPQYFCIALADIWFAIAILEFGYREAPVSLKSSITAIFLLTTSIGDIIVVIITSADPFPNRMTEFFTYATLMTLVMVVFIFLATRYTYVSQGGLEPPRKRNSLKFDTLEAAAGGEPRPSIHEKVTEL